MLSRSLEGNWQDYTHFPLSMVRHHKSDTILGPTEAGYNVRIFLSIVIHVSVTVKPDVRD